jgi:hypothetical protein
VVQLVNKEWDINKDTMDAYVMKIRKLEKKFSRLEIHHVVRDNNVGMDVLSKLGSDRANIPPGVFVHELNHPSIRAPNSSSIAQGPKEPGRQVLMIKVYCRVAFINYFQKHKLSPGVDPKSAEATRILRQSKEYVLDGANLYKRGSASGLLMKCVSMEEGKEILQEIHKGVCGNHAASCTLVSKAFQSGFYWPTALADAEALDRRTNYHGHLHYRALNNYARRFHTRVGGHRQVYQVDRVQANRNAHCRLSGYFHLQYRTPLWLLQHHHYRFWIQFPLATVLGFL